MPNRKQIKSLLGLFVQEVITECLETKAMEMYKALLAKELFLTITSFEELNENYSNVGRLVTTVLKGHLRDMGDVYQRSDEECGEVASKAWQRLRNEYQAE